MVELKRKKATKVFEEDGFKVVRLYSTDVVKFNDNSIILNTGGWGTKTTLQRMNQAAMDYSLSFRIYQKKHQLYVRYLGEDKLFQDGMVLRR